MGDVAPHAVSQQVSSGTVVRASLAKVSHLGERVERPPLDVMRLTSNEYWRAQDQLYPGGSQRSREWMWLREKVMERDGRRCCVCGSTTVLQVDHVLPLGEGGANTYRNLWTLCRECHAVKTGRSVERPA